LMLALVGTTAKLVPVHSPQQWCSTVFDAPGVDIGSMLDECASQAITTTPSGPVERCPTMATAVMNIRTAFDIENARLFGMKARGSNQGSIVQVALLMVTTIDQGASGEEYLGQFDGLGISNMPRKHKVAQTVQWVRQGSVLVVVTVAQSQALICQLALALEPLTQALCITVLNEICEPHFCLLLLVLPL
jgi:hypothetical protein